MMTGLAAMASAQLAAAMAPSAASGSALRGSRFHTVTLWPARNCARARALPMAPRPMTEMSVVVVMVAPAVLMTQRQRYAIRPPRANRAATA